MIFVFRTRTWVPGSPPLGPWGASQGAPRGGFPTQTTRVTFPCRAFEFASKFMSILMSIFDLFGLDLGSLLGVIFGHFGAFFAPSWSRNRLRAVLSSKTCFFTKPFKIKGFRCFFAQDGVPKRPKIAPRRVQDRLGSIFLSLDFSFRFLIVFGSVLVPIWHPKWRPRNAAELC